MSFEEDVTAEQEFNRQYDDCCLSFRSADLPTEDEWNAVLGSCGLNVWMGHRWREDPNQEAPRPDTVFY
jgi:hypothetical protein